MSMELRSAEGGSEDEAVQATNGDATECKCSAVRRGYYRDPYVEHFARRVERKPPEIHLGYLARVRAIDICIQHFLEVPMLLLSASINSQTPTFSTLCICLPTCCSFIVACTIMMEAGKSMEGKTCGMPCQVDNDIF